MKNKRGQIRRFSLCNFFPKNKNRRFLIPPINIFAPRNRRGIVSEYLPWILIALAVLVILMIGIFVLKGKGMDFITQVKNIFTGG